MYKIYNKLNEDIKNIRIEVFQNEQHFTEEFDEIDNNCIHILYFQDEKPVGVARLFNTKENQNQYQIGRVAVLKNYRKYGIGKKIIDQLEKEAKKLKGTSLKLSAQTAVEGFYKKCGFTSVGEEYMDEHCPHIDMVKEI